MKLLNIRRSWLAGHLSALLFGTLLVAAPLKAQDYGIIDDVSVGTSSQGTQIHISFTRPAQYIGHTPKGQSRQLFIDLRLVGSATEIQIPQQQLLRFRPTPRIPITTVTYSEASTTQGRLELSFDRAVSYQVAASSDFRGVVVTLIDDKGALQEPPRPVASPEVEKKTAELMKQARKSLIDERNFARSIALYQQVLDQPANSHSQEALEFLGLAQERMGQREQAKTVYEDYLARYPAGDGNTRVNQRLMSLVTATLPDQQKLRDKKKGEETGWEAYGSLSQYYLRDIFRVEGLASETTVSAFSTNLDLISMRRDTDSDSRFRVTAGHYYDQLATENKSDIRLSSLYAEHHDRMDGWWARGGRQTSSRDGTLGRFDGIKLGYSLSKRVEAGFVAGYPVDSSRDSLDNSRSFTGVSLDLGPYADNWEFSLYGLEQRVEALVDRRAVGGEMRYFRPRLTVLSMIDYDAFYKELNIGMLLANWTLANETTLNATVDVRKSPTLTTQNALTGQITPQFLAVEDITQLRTLYSDDAIYQLARDRTAEAHTMTLGFSHPLTKQLRFSSDLSVMNIGATVGSAGVAATPASGNQYFLNTQMTGTGVLNGDDISTLGLRLSDSSTVKSVGLYTSSRLPLTNNWRIYPRLKVDQLSWKTNSQTQLKVSPIMRVEHSWEKAQFEVELGGEWTSTKLPDNSEQTSGLFGSIGYRLDF